ncbi:MAG TPA: DnaB-like helicase N-terminal domain-containing protein, partial [Fimbriimonas sp.]|nr:DnaB-like helicase N-terminal domain-containing protein [Fimbriimonas sp.]
MSQTPKYNIEAEMSVLGSMILSRRAAEEVSASILEGDFFRPGHQVVFRALSSLLAKKMEIDLVTLRAELTQTKGIDDAGGVAYLVQLAEYVPSAANAEHYAKIVKDLSTRRMLVQTAQKMLALADSEGEVPDIVSTAQDMVAKVSDFSTPVGSGVETIQSVLLKISNEFDADNSVEEDVLSKAFDLNGATFPSKHEKLNEIIDGFDRGGVYTIGARSGMGKTAYAIDEACHLATIGHPILFVTR